MGKLGSEGAFFGIAKLGVLPRVPRKTDGEIGGCNGVGSNRDEYPNCQSSFNDGYFLSSDAGAFQDIN